MCWVGTATCKCAELVLGNAFCAELFRPRQKQVICAELWKILVFPKNKMLFCWAFLGENAGFLHLSRNHSGHFGFLRFCSFVLSYEHVDRFVLSYCCWAFPGQNFDFRVPWVLFVSAELLQKRVVLCWVKDTTSGARAWETMVKRLVRRAAATAAFPAPLPLHSP